MCLLFILFGRKITFTATQEVARSTHKLQKQLNNHTMLSSKAKRGFTASFLIGLALVSIIVYDRDLKYYKQVFEMLGRDHRRISINLGDGNCEWTAPIRQPPTEIDFHKTLIAGYPSGWVSVCLVLISMIRATTYSSLYWFQ